MNQRRENQRLRTLLKGRIVFNGRFSLIDCMVRDLSATGARIAFPHPIPIPPAFDLEIPVKGMSVSARLIWSNGKEHGVVFTEEAQGQAHGQMPWAPGKPPPAGNTLLEQAASGPVNLHVEAILDEARRRIAHTMGVPADTIRLKIEAEG